MRKNDRPSETMPHRDVALDVLRILGIVAVIVGHVTTDNAVRSWIYPWHVPLFFFLSGYFWKAGRTLRQEFLGRFRTLAKPYLAWLLVIAGLLGAAMLASGDLNVVRLILATYGGAAATLPFSSFWFISVLFFAALLFRFLETLPKWVTWCVSLTGLVIAEFTGGLLGFTPLGIGLALPCLLFMAAGNVFKSRETQFRMPALWGALLSIGGMALVWTGLSSPLDIKQTHFGTPVVGAISAVAICAGVILLARSVNRIAGPTMTRGIDALAASGTAVVLLHPAILLACSYLEGSNWIRDLVIVMTVSWGIGLVLVHTGLSPWMCGVAKRPLARPAIRKVMQIGA